MAELQINGITYQVEYVEVFNKYKILSPTVTLHLVDEPGFSQPYSVTPSTYITGDFAFEYYQTDDPGTLNLVGVVMPDTHLIRYISALNLPYLTEDPNIAEGHAKSIIEIPDSGEIDKIQWPFFYNLYTNGGYTSPNLFRDWLKSNDKQLYLKEQDGQISLIELTESEATSDLSIIGPANVEFVVSGKNSYRVVDYDVDYRKFEIP